MILFSCILTKTGILVRDVLMCIIHAFIPMYSKLQLLFYFFVSESFTWLCFRKSILYTPTCVEVRMCTFVLI